jgi:hypothetical protein
VVAQITTREMCDQVTGSYIRGAFELSLAENSTNTSARVLEGTVFGAVHCDGHHYVAAMRNDIKAVEIGDKTKNILGRNPAGDSGVARDSAVAAFTKDLIDASQAGL